MKQKSVLGYGSGMGCTWDGFWYTDRVASTNECINRYSSAKFYFTGHDGRSISGMNIEHSFPKSWWGGDKNDGYKDLFNLYPSDSKANNSKSNYAMGIVTEVTSQSGEGYDKVGYGDAGSRKHVRLWEPGDGFKGEFCRSYMYMATTYQYLNFTSEGLNQLENGDYPTLQQWSSDLFRQWNGQDRVDDVETARNDAVYELQHNRNLFIDYPYLCEYVWGDSMDVAFDPETSITTASDDSRYLQQVQPKVDKPVFTPAAGTYSEAQEVAITCSTPDAVIYYTLDGSEPTDADTRYTAAITVDKDMTIRPWPTWAATRASWRRPTTSSATACRQLPLHEDYRCSDGRKALPDCRRQRRTAHCGQACQSVKGQELRLSLRAGSQRIGSIHHHACRRRACLHLRGRCRRLLPQGQQGTLLLSGCRLQHVHPDYRPREGRHLDGNGERRRYVQHQEQRH